MENTEDRQIQSIQPGHEEPEPKRFTLSFTGSGGEYFRIWIVNVALTALTLGIYGAWAKVRTRRYFYANTILDGQPFDYLARPGTILKGYLIVGGVLIVMNLLNNFVPRFGILFSAVAISSVPYLLYKAHRFKAVNSAYRNVRFRFIGDVGGAYVAYVIFPLAALMSLMVALPVFLGSPGGPEPGAVPRGPAVGLAALSGLVFVTAYPYMVFLKRRYFHDNMAYGKTDSSFSGRSGFFYGIYVSAVFMALLAVFGGGLLVGMTGKLVTDLFFGKSSLSSGIGTIAVALLIYAFFAFLFVFIQQYVFAGTFNYAWKHSQLGFLFFDVSLEAKNLAWIRFTNLVAIIFSLGLLIPWAKVRRVRYILSHTAVLLTGDMDAFEAAIIKDEGAVGDTAADFFDWDIGW